MPNQMAVTIDLLLGWQGNELRMYETQQGYYKRLCCHWLTEGLRQEVAGDYLPLLLGHIPRE